MTIRFLRGAAAIIALFAVPACDLDVSNGPNPGGPPIDVTLDFCSDDMPIWVAYQAETDWVRVTPDANGTIAFSAPYRTLLAFVHQNNTDTRVEVIATFNTVLDKVSGQTCREEVGTKVVNGSFAGVQSGQLALVGMGFASLYRTQAQNTFTLSNVASRPLDLIASRMNIVGTTEQHANRTIIRRSQNIVSGGTVPVLDFDASEAILPTSAVANVSGLTPNDQASITNNFFSQLETSHLMTYKEGIGNGSHELDAIPAASLATGDYHDVFVTAVTASQGVRGYERFFRAPGTHTLSLGTTLSPPTVTTPVLSPYAQPQVSQPIQVEYPSAVSAEFQQQSQFSSTTWRFTVTAGVFSNVQVNAWLFALPDLSGVTGWQNSWGLSGSLYDWTVTAYGVRAELLFGAPPGDNEFTLYATRMSEPTSPRVFERTRASRPYQFGRRR